MSQQNQTIQNIPSDVNDAINGIRAEISFLTDSIESRGLSATTLAVLQSNRNQLQQKLNAILKNHGIDPSDVDTSAEAARSARLKELSKAGRTTNTQILIYSGLVIAAVAALYFFTRKKK